MEFIIPLFKVWLQLKDMNSVASALRKAQMDKRLLVSGIQYCFYELMHLVLSNRSCYCFGLLSSNDRPV